MNSGLVLGTQRALVIDTGAGPRQGREILTAVRELTELPLTVVNTHAHYDHYMGNAVFTRAGATEFWAHKACAAAMAEVAKTLAKVEDEDLRTALARLGAAIKRN